MADLGAALIMMGKSNDLPALSTPGWEDVFPEMRRRSAVKFLKFYGLIQPSLSNFALPPGLL